MKRLFTLFCAFFILIVSLVPASSAFAYTPHGILFGKPTTNASTAGLIGLNTASDSNSSTFISMGASQWIEWDLGGDKTLNNLYWEVDDIPYTDFYFYDSNHVEVTNTATRPSVGSWSAASPTYYKNIRYVRIVTQASLAGSRQVKEVDIQLADSSPPTAPTNVTAVTSNGQAVLSWTAATDDVGVTGYNIYKDGTKIGSSAGTSFTASGLLNNTTYTWTVKAYDAVANEGPPSTAITSNNFADVNAPTKPAGLTATPSSGSAALSWSASTDAVGVTGYYVYKDGTRIGTATGTSYTASGLLNNTTYAWTVSAYDAAGNESLKSDPANTMFDTVSPLAPIGLTVDSTGSGYVNLKWTPNTEPDLAGYNAYADSVKNNGSLIAIASYTVTGLVNDHTYIFQVTAVDSSGNESAKSDSVTYIRDSTPPAAPTGVNMQAVSGNAVVNWTAPPDLDVDGYNVYDAATGTKINNTLINGTSYTADTLVVNHNYTYQVTAVDSAGNESPKSTKTPVYTYTPPATPPTGGTGLGSIGAISWGFQASDIVTNSVWILGALAAFVLLGLSIGRISPIISLVREAVKKS
jgi:fibronectin type 3 domain-containing protein